MDVKTTLCAYWGRLTRGNKLQTFCLGGDSKTKRDVLIFSIIRFFFLNC